MNSVVAPLASTQRRLEYLPVGLFGSVMGLTGLSVAWRLASAQFSTLTGWAWIAPAVAVIAMAAFVLMLLGYSLKMLTAWEAVEAEFRHPIAGSLFGTVAISMLLLPIVLAPYALALARWLWIAGAVTMVIFAWFIVSRWMSDRQQVAHATPAWIIPVVGLLDVPLAVPGLGLPPLHGLSVFAVAVGLFFAIPLFTLILSRLLFEAPLPDPLKPSLLILVAPFSVGCSAYSVVVGQVDLFAQALYMLMLFILAVLLGHLRKLPVCCPFRVSWWAVSFPLAASAIAAIRIARAMPGTVTELLCVAAACFGDGCHPGAACPNTLGSAQGRTQDLKHLRLNWRAGLHNCEEP